QIGLSRRRQLRRSLARAALALLLQELERPHQRVAFAAARRALDQVALERVAPLAFELAEHEERELLGEGVAAEAVRIRGVHGSLLGHARPAARRPSASRRSARWAVVKTS